MITPDIKIKVFISSKCGEKKYDRIRNELKNMIEATQLAEVYLFEDKGASTVSAEEHYVWHLADSDVCIFLIDNKDGIPDGVQKEIDIVQKHGIKALYYFCDEFSKEKTALEESLMGAMFAKSKTIHSFDDFSENGAQGIISDITFIYHSYCKGRLKQSEDSEDELHSVDIEKNSESGTFYIPKYVLKNTDKTKGFIMRFLFGDHFWKKDNDDSSSIIDEWGEQFLQILLEGKTIKQFNVDMFIDVLKGIQSSGYNEFVKLRWKAIQFYFMGDIDKCIAEIKTALNSANEINQPAWVINDILIDLRNMQQKKCIIDNRFSESEAQQELNKRNDSVYYPILDRINENLQKKYTAAYIKDMTVSPYSFTIGNDLNEYGELLASSIIIPMINGSLTHILLFLEQLRIFLFSQCSRYSDWILRTGLLKFTIYSGKIKDVQGIIRAYPEVINKMESEDAESIMRFCSNHPFYYERLQCQLNAFGIVGYYLNDHSFNQYRDLMIKEIKAWILDDTAVVNTGNDIFGCLNRISHRLSQKTIFEICSLFFERKYARWYENLFKYMNNYVDLREMEETDAKKLIQYVLDLMEDEGGRKQISYVPMFLEVFRLQSPELTDELDKKVKESFPDYYNEKYVINTTDNIAEYPNHISNMIKKVNVSNEKQGKDGIYYGHGTKDIAFIRALILRMSCSQDFDIDSVISIVTDTLLKSREEISIKMDALDLLICIVQKYPDDYERNKGTFNRIVVEKESIKEGKQLFSSNIDRLALEIGLQLLFTAMGEDTYRNMIELMACIQGDTRTIISVSEAVWHYLEPKGQLIVVPELIEQLLLQSALQWIQNREVDIRRNAVKILFCLLRNEQNKTVINQQLVKLIDSDGPQIKALILQRLETTENVENKIKEYIQSKCKNDSNYIIRNICEEQLG